jgi:hypothetical protein
VTGLAFWPLVVGTSAGIIAAILLGGFWIFYLGGLCIGALICWRMERRLRRGTR